MAHPMMAALERELVLYRRLWQASVFSSFLLPLLFVLSIGVGVGSYIPGGIGGVSYAAFVVPGVLVTTAFQIAIGESTYPVLGGFKWQRNYHAMRATPVQPGHMVGGHLLYLVFRAEIATVCFLIVVSLFGAVESWWAVATPPVVALVAVAAAAPVTAFAATIENDSYFSLLFRFGLIPATLFSGVFFPVTQLPALFRPLAYASPLWHGVVLCRAATLGELPNGEAWWTLLLHVLYLVLWGVVGIALAIWRFGKRLQD